MKGANRPTDGSSDESLADVNKAGGWLRPAHFSRQKLTAKQSRLQSPVVCTAKGKLRKYKNASFLPGTRGDSQARTSPGLLILNY